jgi:L-lactate dehydrogenase complex protein LldG
MDAEAERKAVFARVRKACARSDAAAVNAERAALTGGCSAPLPDPDPVISLAVNLMRQHATVDVVRGRAEAVRAIGAYLGKHYGNRKLVAGADPRLAAMPWREAGVLPRFGNAEDGDPVAVSHAELGVAETGSVALVSGRGKPARNALLPEDHLIMVDTASVVATLDEAWDRLPHLERNRPRGVMLISGPSSTADIAMRLVWGAHGPRRLHVVLFGDCAPDALARARALLDPETTG